MSTQTLALLGATGGAGTTRLAVECGATLARAGRDVAVLDAALGTQGLVDYVEGPVDADLTGVVTDEARLADALYECPVGADVPGRLALCPARAPFERLSRAKTAGGAERFEKQLAAAALSYDTVVVDTPPLATNPAVASVDAAERVAVVTPDTVRGADALARTRGRLADVGAGLDAVLANYAGETATVTDADARIPRTSTAAPGDCPSCVPPDGTFAPAVARAVACALGTSLDLGFPSEGPLGGLLDG
jgi:MinD-like ATPase involved in chromosome partitioning or flagellar assembly